MQIPSFRTEPRKGTPESVERRRRMAESLIGQATDVSPVGHWTQGLAKALQGGIGGYQMARADQMEERGQAASREALARALQGGDNASLMEAMDDPYMSRGGQAMLAQQWQQNNDPTSELERRYKEAQIKALESKGSDARARLGLNPQYGVDAQGNPVLLQIGEDGSAVQTQMPEGVSLSKEPIRLDAGTHFVLLDPITRQPVGQIPKQLAEAEAEKAQGKAQGEAQATLPAARITADQTIGYIDQLLNDPDLSGLSGVESWMPDAAAGVYNPNILGLRRRIEQLRGGAFLEAYNGLRGGGQITEVEGKKAENALARLETAQSDQDFVQALKDFKDAVQMGYAKLEARAGSAAPAANQPKRRRYNPATGALE